VLCDAFRLPFRSESIDITYSEGVLEHYKPIEILQLLKEIIRISSKAFIFSCPMKGYPIFEDAIELNLYSLENWKKIMKIFQMQKRNFIIRIYLYFVLSPKIILYKLLKGKIGYDSIIIIIEKVK
jgi:ubiquinone/menaquinone biosynthesis C-methylase UbiE